MLKEAYNNLFYKIFYLIIAPEKTDTSFGLEYYQNVVFSVIFRVSVAVTSIAYIPSVIAATQDGFYDIAAIDTLFLIWVYYLFFNKNLTSAFKKKGICISYFFISVFLVFKLGPNGAGILWLFTFPIISVIFSEPVNAIKFLCITFFIIIFITCLKLLGIISWPHNLSIEKLWYIEISNFILLSSILTISLATIYEGLGKTVNILENRISEIKQTHKATIECLAALAEYKDPETGSHINRTQLYVNMLANQMLKNIDFKKEFIGLTDIDHLSMSAPLHDVGKVGIPEHILNKPGKLSPSEFEEMKKHTIYGREVLSKSENNLGPSSFLKYAQQMAHSHHEKWDGSGYPLGLKGEQIPLPGRIMAVADVYDALRNKRSYKEAFSHQKSLDIIRNDTGSHFDPTVVEAFFQMEAQFEEISESLKEKFE